MDKDLVSFCGIYCGACPSLNKSCLGCRTEEKRGQKRKSKWGCKIRTCCHNEKNLDFCIECEVYPCKNLSKLKNSHLEDERFDYRHQMFYNLVRIEKIGLEEWLEEQSEIWKCPKCMGRVGFYYNKCVDCGEDMGNLLKEYMNKTE